MDEKEFILEVLDLFAEKVRNNSCTKEQYDAVSRVTAENLPLFATAEEIARHYGKSVQAVHSVIKNKMIEKPKRNVTLYPFKAFARIVPLSWRKRH